MSERQPTIQWRYGARECPSRKWALIQTAYQLRKIPKSLTNRLLSEYDAAWHCGPDQGRAEGGERRSVILTQQQTRHAPTPRTRRAPRGYPVRMITDMLQTITAMRAEKKHLQRAGWTARGIDGEGIEHFGTWRESRRRKNEHADAAKKAWAGLAHGPRV